MWLFHPELQCYPAGRFLAYSGRVDWQADAREAKANRERSRAGILRSLAGPGAGLRKASWQRQRSMRTG